MSIWTTLKRLTAANLNDAMTGADMTLSYARYVQLSTQRSNATNWLTDQQGWFNQLRKSTTLVTHGTSGTPLVSQFTVNKTGVWSIKTGVWFNAQNSRVAICKGGVADANILASSSFASGCTVAADVDLVSGDVIMIRWIVAAGAAMVQSVGDNNFVSFHFKGAFF